MIAFYIFTGVIYFFFPSNIPQYFLLFVFPVKGKLCCRHTSVLLGTHKHSEIISSIQHTPYNAIGWFCTAIQPVLDWDETFSKMFHVSWKIVCKFGLGSQRNRGADIPWRAVNVASMSAAFISCDSIDVSEFACFMFPRSTCGTKTLWRASSSRIV